jgi:hypothetical protein
MGGRGSGGVERGGEVGPQTLDMLAADTQAQQADRDVFLASRSQPGRSSLSWTPRLSQC